MGTTIRAKLSERNKYYIEKHRYYELKHFCLQYNIWKQAYNSLSNLGSNISQLDMISVTHNISDPTSKIAMQKEFYSKRIEMIERAATDADDFIHNYILKAVTQGLSFTYLKTVLDIPCERDMYYDRYRKFFYILNSLRD